VEPHRTASQIWRQVAGLGDECEVCLYVQAEHPQCHCVEHGDHVERSQQEFTRRAPKRKKKGGAARYNKRVGNRPQKSSKGKDPV